MNWISRLAALASGGQCVARAVIVSTHGPTPRAVGTAMIVTPARHEGRIGRPEVMAAVTAAARAMIVERRAAGERAVWLRRRETLATGQVMGASSGGHVEILIEVFSAAELRALADAGHDLTDDRWLARPMASGAAMTVLDPRSRTAPPEWRAAIEALAAEPDRLLALAAGGTVLVERRMPILTPFHVYGTGLVARALVGLLAGLPFDVVWHDRSPARFPASPPAGVRLGTAGSPTAGAAAATSGSFHAVMTGDHDEDLAVCRVLARAGTFGFLGVIGARLKRERLIARLQQDGIARPLLDRISCPVGLAGIHGSIHGKDPNVIAVSIAAEALLVLQRR